LVDFGYKNILEYILARPEFARGRAHINGI